MSIHKGLGWERVGVLRKAEPVAGMDRQGIVGSKRLRSVHSKHRLEPEAQEQDVSPVPGHTAGRGDPEATRTLCQEILFVVPNLAKLLSSNLRATAHFSLGSSTKPCPQRRCSGTLTGRYHSKSNLAALRVVCGCVCVCGHAHADLATQPGTRAQSRRSQPGQPRPPGDT